MQNLQNEMQQLKRQGKLGPRNKDEQNQQNMSIHAKKYQCWVEPSQTEFAIKRRSFPSKQINDPVYGKCLELVEPQYKTIHRKNNKEFNIRYTSGMNSVLWDCCPHCLQQIRKRTLLECESCGRTVSYMLEYVQQANFGKTKIAPHIIGCTICPPRTNNIVLCSELNQDQLCLACFDKQN